MFLQQLYPAATSDERFAMFPSNPFHSKHPVIDELEEVFPEALRAAAVTPGALMFPLPPSPFQKVPTLTELPPDETALFSEVENESTKHEDEDDDRSSEICPACNGSGEGVYEGSSCGTCHPRRGSRNNQDQFEEQEAPDHPANFEG